MKRTLPLLRGEIDRIRSLLEQDLLFSFSATELEQISAALEKCAGKLDSIETSFLMIGLLGGTGVGKSTLMNALAGEQIASTSHRRPHTDKVLLYRHRNVQVPTALQQASIPWLEISHDADVIQHVLLCDLPDFDSLLGEHRERVAGFLEYLDVLVWVTSPEKYADGRFYEFLQTVAKAEQNFVFVLNKIDMLFDGKSEQEAYQQLDLVGRTFQRHIHDHGIGDPLLYLVSALQAFTSAEVASWNQFPSFRRYLFQQRDFKQVSAIKTANLDVEIDHFRTILEKEIKQLTRFSQIVAAASTDVEEQRAQWMQAGAQAIDHWLSTGNSPNVFMLAGEPSVLVGPGYALGVLLESWHRRFADKRAAAPATLQFRPPEEVSTVFRDRLVWLAARMDHSLLRHSMPESLRHRVQQILEPDRVARNLENRFARAAAAAATEAWQPTYRGFKAIQFIGYGFLLAAFLFAIGPEASWQQVLEAPGLKSFMQLVLSTVHVLFSSKGLAALGSYLLLNLIVAYRFYRRYRNLLHKQAQKRMAALREVLLQIWQEQVNDLAEELARLNSEVEAEIALIAGAESSQQGASRPA
ncbi:MAG: 50S ribosome-binding GTPase [Deltaproteobacteria bacterium]|nr:50S ribosome-binding GTPase [Deltaproteobacteria bacterium]MBW2071648.1 50S ribosome-binding GTPase [Deltaproteobacteria bacterium]